MAYAFVLESGAFVAENDLLIWTLQIFYSKTYYNVELENNHTSTICVSDDAHRCIDKIRDSKLQTPEMEDTPPPSHSPLN